jgi:hypothetical protein
MSQHQDPAPSEGPEPSSPEPSSPERRKAFARFLDFVEWLGNLLPHPVTLFAIFCVAVILGSGVASWLGLEVADPRPAGARGRSPDGMIEVVSLLNGAGLRQILEQLVDNFVEFVPLGTVLVAMLGVGVAEKSGLLDGGDPRRGAARSAAPRHLCHRLRGRAVQYGERDGLCGARPARGRSTTRSGRHPLAGMAAAFAGRVGRLQREPVHRHGRSAARRHHRGSRGAADRPGVRGPPGGQLVLHDRRTLLVTRRRRLGGDGRSASSSRGSARTT